MNRRALIVGIDKYSGLGDDPLESLTAPSRDAARLMTALTNSADPQYNWKVKLVPDLSIPDPENIPVTTDYLWNEISDFFSAQGPQADLLFYFAGHGISRFKTGVLATSDTTQNSGGIPMPDLMRLIEETGPNIATSITVILDCCGSGIMNDISNSSRLPSNTSILTASFSQRNAYETTNDSSVFSSILLEGLKGQAAQGFSGRVTVASLMSFINEKFNEENHDQRPTFHAVYSDIPVLRTVDGWIKAYNEEDVEKLLSTFCCPTARIKMKPTNEKPNLLGLDRGQDNSDEHKTDDQKQFDFFKKLQNAGLLTADAEGGSLYWACGFDQNGEPTRDPKDVYLTPEGQSVWRAADQRRTQAKLLAQRGARR